METKILYSKCYNYIPNYRGYEDLATQNNIEIPKQVIRNVAGFDMQNNTIHYFGTARVGAKTKPIILAFFNKLKTIRGEN